MRSGSVPLVSRFRDVLTAEAIETRRMITALMKQARAAALSQIIRSPLSADARSIGEIELADRN